MDAEYHRQYSREHYRQNKAKYLAKAKIRNQKQREAMQRLVNRYKVFKGCAHCGYKRHAVALDLHHVEKKTESIGRMVSTANSNKKLKAEIRKCQVLCANCHRVEHHTNPELS